MLREPNRFRGLFSAARGAELARRREKATTYYSHLLTLAAHSKLERPELHCVMP